MALIEVHEGAVSRPLSPEQLAVVDAADGELGCRRACLLETEAPLDFTRFMAALEAALGAHELLQYRVARVEGFRVPRLCKAEGNDVALFQAAPLSIPDGSDAMAAATSWLEQLPSHLRAQGLTAPDGTGGAPEFMVASIGAHHMALAFDPLLFDEGSVRYLVARAFASLGGAVGGPAEFQYPQYIEWRRALESAEEGVTGREYWDRYVDAALSVRPPELSYRIARGRETRPRVRSTRRVRLQQADRLATLARQHDTSVEVLLQALWWVLLARLTGVDRFIAGWQHDCRADYEVMAGSVGVFEKVLPMIVDVVANESVAQWVTRFAGVARGHVEQQEYWPLVDSPVATHRLIGFAAAPELKVETIASWQVHVVPDVAPGFELALHVAPAGDSLAWAVLLDPAHYPDAAAERLAQQFEVLLAAALEDTTRQVGELALVGNDERTRLLGLNPSGKDFGAESVLQRILRWADETPEAPALADNTGVITYRELASVVRRKADWLRNLGVKPGSLVALALPRSVDLVSSLLAVWQVGAGYLPIEPDWPPLRRLAVLEDAQPVVLIHASLPDDAGRRPWIDVVADWDEWATHPGSVPDNRGSGLQEIAYVLYTSGSTGKPKGVVIEHAQLLNYVAAVSDALQLQHARRWALVSTVAADLGNTALFGALFCGACLVVARPEDVGDGEAFSRFIDGHGIDAIKIVPSHLEALLESEHARLPRTIVLGGEAAPRSLIERIRTVAPQAVIHNHYGPTETTVGVMVHTLGAGAELPAVLPLTRVLDNNRVHVLDEALRLVPTGARGELYVGGAQVCRGYLNRDGDGDFVADPFMPGQRLYRTRDLAYVLPDGGIRLAGRGDEQLKVRGFRVNPAEVEAVLLTKPGVRQAVVLAAGDGHATSELVAFLLGEAGIDAQTIRAGLHAELPTHMIPARIAVLDELPRLANGKVDRQAVRQLGAGIVSQHANVPTDPLEFEIASDMASLLECEVLGPDQDFFELGAHSLTVIKLVARLRKRFDIEIAPGVVFDHATPAALAAALRDKVGRVDSDLQTGATALY